MPMAYTGSLATAASTSTSGTPSTEVEVFFVKPGVRNVAFYAIDVNGMGAGLTALSGIGFRFVRWGTASTSGTSITPTPKDPGMQAAKATSASAPTLGTTRLNRMVFGCGCAGPGGWWAKNADAMELQEGGAATSMDVISVSGTASMSFSWSYEIHE